MARKNNNKIISVVHRICCGLDVHKDMICCLHHYYWNRNAGRYISEASQRDINMIGQPSAQQIVGIDHVNETTVSSMFFLTLETFLIDKEACDVMPTVLAWTRYRLRTVSNEMLDKVNMMKISEGINRRIKKFQKFFYLYTSGLSHKDIEQLLKKDTVDAFSYFKAKSKMADQSPKRSSAGTFFYMAKVIFISFMMQLTPARRFFYGLGFAGLTEFPGRFPVRRGLSIYPQVPMPAAGSAQRKIQA